MTLRILFFTPVLLATLTACSGGSVPAPPAAAPVAAAAPSPVVAAAPPVAAPAPAPAAALSPVIEEAMGRVQGLFVDPSDAAIKATFSPTFLATIPADKVKALFTETKGQVGTCKEHRAEQVKNDTAAVVRLQCERGAFHTTIVVNPAPPHLIEGLLLKPAP